MQTKAGIYRSDKWFHCTEQCTMKLLTLAIYLYIYIYGLTRILIKLWSRVRRHLSDFHEWRSHEQNHLQIASKKIAAIPDQKHNYSRQEIHHFISDSLSTSPQNDVDWSVTSRQREALVLWRNIHRKFWYAPKIITLIFISIYHPWYRAPVTRYSLCGVYVRNLLFSNNVAPPPFFFY